MASLDPQIGEFDFKGMHRARVITNSDHEGVLGVFIPTLVTDMPDDLEESKPVVTPLSDPIFENQTELGLSQNVREDNFILARPCAWLVENGRSSSNSGGSFRVPRVGTDRKSVV